MARYAYIQNTENPLPNGDLGTLIKERKLDNFDAAAVAHKLGPWPLARRVIAVVRLTDPVIPEEDQATKELGGTVTVIEADRVTRQKVITDIPQARLDDEADLASVKAGVEALIAGIAAIEAGTGDTALQRLTRVENGLIKVAKGVIRLAHDQYGKPPVEEPEV